MKIVQDTLNVKSVQVLINEDTKIYKGYPNSSIGRAQLESEVPDYLVAEIYKVWGETPTVTELIYNIPPTTPQPSDQDFFNAEMMFRVNALEMGA